MKKRSFKFSLSGLIGALCMAVLGGVIVMAIADYTGCSGRVVGNAGAAAITIGFCLSCIPGKGRKRNMAYMAIQTEIWTNYIDENLYKDNTFLEQSMDHSEYVDNLTVHSPQAGDDGEVVENRTVFPATVTSRTDTTVDWDINEYTVSPWKISNAEEVELSYNKLESMLYSRRAILDEKIANGALYTGAPTGTATLRNGGGTNKNILRSSGIPNNDLLADKVYSAAYTSATATGSRLNFGLYDIRQAKLLLDNQNVPKEGRCIIFSGNAMDQVISDLIATKFRDSIAEYNTSTGELSTIMGFKVFSRSTTVLYTNAATPVAKATTAAGTADENDSVLFWHKAALRRAKGETKVYDDADRPEYYGKLFSILKRFGMTISRNDEIGVGAIVQTAYVPVGN